ncbi:hypothetical protein DKX38_007374 [Salix brachista]|uniref:Uncharacterized protein n=1 Tax=Salix brachista TaxID=2182728 RepID=A0A5N5MMS6_9ROSI|nr:hypothetical protein DKX38_007374 [Salix brachista]
MRKKSVLIGGGLAYCYKRWMSSSSSEGTKRFAAVWGNGDYGRLGFGNLDSTWWPKLINSSSFHNSNLKSISCGGAHTLFLTEAYKLLSPAETGRVYATGLNDFGQIGISDSTTYCMEPLEVSGLKKEIVQISAGYHHSCAITEAENVVPVPTKVECLSGINIKMVALASEHSIAVTDGGQALSWGGGGSGRLGHGHQSSLLGFFRSSSEYTPRHIKKLEGVKVKNIAAGLLHSACIDENGSVYIFGEKAVDKLAFGNANNATTPSMIGKLPYSQEVACGGYHTCVITMVYKNQCHLIALCYKRCEYEGLEEQGCAEDKNPNNLEDIGGHFIRKLDFVMMELLAFVDLQIYFELEVTKVVLVQRHVRRIVNSKFHQSDLKMMVVVNYTPGAQMKMVVLATGLQGGTLTCPLFPSRDGILNSIDSLDSCFDYFMYRYLVVGSIQQRFQDYLNQITELNYYPSEGNVFTWGWGGSHGTFSEDGLSSGGQLGHGDDMDYINPTLVAFEKKMKAVEVSCGFNHTGAILESVDA